MVSSGPRQAILVLIAYASSEGSGEPAHPPEPPLLAHTSSESRGTFRQKARSLTTQNGWACTVKICHDRMLEDTNSLYSAYLITRFLSAIFTSLSGHIWSCFQSYDGLNHMPDWLASKQLK